MKKKFLSALVMLGIATCTLASCKDEIKDNTYYASVKGKASATGTSKKPLDIRTAFTKLSAGDTLILKEGTYELSSRILVSEGQNGTKDNMIKVIAEEGKKVVIDFSEQEIASTSRGIQVNSDYWYFYGLDIMGAGDNGMYIAGSYNIVENCSFHENQDTGLQIGRASSTQTNIKEWPHNNLIKNCTSYNNYDYQSYGENADGFAAKLTTGEGNVFDGCIAYRNSDDGWDLYAKSDSGNVGTTIIKNCVAFENGWLLDKTAAPDDSDLNERGTTNITTTAKMLAKQSNKSYATRDGDGIGFKLGGSSMEGNVIVENCMSFNNRLHGFSDNSNPGVLSLSNCTAYNNSAAFNEETGEVLANSNSSNNFDLARDENSYNNYYGLLSYMTNQTDSSLTYSNKDKFRGSIGYSILNTGRNKYSTFKSYEDGSSYESAKSGKAYNNMSDSVFKSVNFQYNANGNRNLHTLLRNSDMSINMQDMLDVVSEELLTYCDGNQIGCKLNLSSWDAYDHYDMGNYTSSNLDEDYLVLKGARDVLEIMCNPDAVYQNVKLITKVNNCDVVWSSSDELIVQCGKPREDNPNEFITNSSVSGVTYIDGIINRDRNKDVKVTLTATITYNEKSITKDFVLNIKKNIPTIGELVGFDDRYILTMFTEYELPSISVLNAAMYTEENLIEGVDYLVETSIQYANSTADFESGNYFDVSKVYTSIPGVYKVIYNVESLISEESFETYFYAYVVSEEANIDISVVDGSPELEVNVSRDGVSVSAVFTNILGTLYIYTSTNETETAQTIVENGNVYDITDETLDALYEMPNNEEYYVHVCVNNKKGTIENPTVYSKQVTIEEIKTCDDFYNLVTGSTKSTVIYLLQNDLDFEGYEWKTSSQTFGGLFNGNGYTIKNINIVNETRKQTAIFYKLKKGTIMNVSFENISLEGTASNESLAGIVGQMAGGYIHNVSLKNISSTAASGAAALVGQVSGEINYITQVSLINDSSSVISVINKYCGGLVANVQKDSDQSRVELYITNCFVKATIGNGKDGGGYIGGIVGRCKNEYESCVLRVEKSVFEGQVQTAKDYSGGILGGADNGTGTIYILRCASNCTILLKGELLDGIAASAAKNDSPVVGRVTKGIGTWFVSLCYGKFVDSQFTTEDFLDSYDYTLSIYTTKAFFSARLALDLDNIWTFNEETSTISLKTPKEVIELNSSN